MSVGTRVIGVSALALLVAMSQRAAAECPPIAVPLGDPTLVETVSARLRANGVTTAATDGCPAVRVHLERRGQQLHLRVADGYQRHGERAVQDVATAAAIIESWTLQEVETGMLPELPAAPPPATSLAAAPAIATTGLAVSLRSAITEQSSTWLGGSVSACARVAWACLGATVRAAKDIEATGATSSDDHHLWQIDVLATADVPRRALGFGISPGLDLGYAWQRITSVHVDAHMMPVTQVDSAHALRAGAHVRISRPVTTGLELFGELSGDAAIAQSGISRGPTTAFGLSLGARIEAP